MGAGLVGRVYIIWIQAWSQLSSIVSIVLLLIILIDEIILVCLLWKMIVYIGLVYVLFLPWNGD